MILSVSSLKYTIGVLVSLSNNRDLENSSIFSFNIRDITKSASISNFLRARVILEVPTEDELNELMEDIGRYNIDENKFQGILRYFVLKGHSTKDEIITQFTLSDHSQFRPLIATLKAQDLVKSGRGYYPTSKLIQLVKLINKLGGIKS